jgi:hypothetical protein
MEAQSVPKVCKLILVRFIDSMSGKIFKVFELVVRLWANMIFLQNGKL